MRPKFLNLAVVFTLFTWIFLGCTHISAPVEDVPNFTAPEPLVQATETMPFTLPVELGVSFHPTMVESSINRVLSPLMYESLYYLNENYEAVENLVSSSWVSDNGLQWVFTLKEGIYFSDGTLMTGRIVASSLNEAKSVGSYYESRFSEIWSITGTDTTVTVSLTTPNYMLPCLLDIPISYGGGTLPLGSGPYQYNEYHCKLIFNENWWQDLELPREVELVPITKEGQLISAFDAGALSVVDGDLPTNYGLGFSGNYQVWEYHNSHFFYLGVQSNWGGNQKTLMSLCSQVIDRDKLVDLALAGYGVSARYPVHPYSEMGRALPVLEFNPSEVSERLSTLAAQSYTIDLMVNENSTQKVAIAQEIAEQLRQYDVRITVSVLSLEEYLSKLQSGDFQLFVGEAYLTPDFNLKDLILEGGAYAYGRSGTSWLETLWKEYRLKGTSVLDLAETADGDWIIEENFFSYVTEYSSVIPLFFKNGTLLSSWGHLDYATPVQNNLFYGLEDWVFRYVQ